MPKREGLIGINAHVNIHSKKHTYKTENPNLNYMLIQVP